MSPESEIELIRTRWRRHLATQALDSIEREDFSQGGLATRAAATTVRLLLLPSDPDSGSLDLDEELWEWLQEQKTMPLGNGNIHLGDKAVPTAHAAAIIRDDGENPAWKSYTTVHRNRVVEIGLGDRGAWTSTTTNGSKSVFSLIPAVAYTWAMLELARGLPAEPVSNGPYLLAVALRNTKGALLGHRGEGWGNARSPIDGLGGCQEKHLLWHIELDQLPNSPSASQAVAFQVGDRIENAWGCRQRIYLDNAGVHKGAFDVNRLNR